MVSWVIQGFELVLFTIPDREARRMSVMTIRTAEQLLAPISTAEFRDRYLEKEILHLERNDPSLVEGMFDMAVLEDVIR